MGLLVATFAIFIIVIFTNQIGVLRGDESNEKDAAPGIKLSFTPTPTPSASSKNSSQPSEQTIKAYLIDIDANAPESELIGCGDKIAAITQNRTTVTPLEDAINLLLSINDEFYADTGLYNALWKSDLSLTSAEVENGVAQIALNGQLRLAGACDEPRVKEQLAATVTQFDTINTANITLNGQPLDDALSTK